MIVGPRALGNTREETERPAPGGCYAPGPGGGPRAAVLDPGGASAGGRNFVAGS